MTLEPGFVKKTSGWLEAKLMIFAFQFNSVKTRFIEKSWFPLLPKTFLLEALGYFMISICLTRISMFFKSWVQRLRGESTDWDIILDQTYSGFSTLIGWKLKESTSPYLVKKLNTGWLVTIMNIWRKILICFLYFTRIIFFPTVIECQFVRGRNVIFYKEKFTAKCE